MYINENVLNITNGNIKMLDTEFGMMNIEKAEVGKLKLVSGKIICTDPILMYDDQCYSKKVKPGVYPVYIYMGKVEERKNQTILAELRFNDGIPVKWEMALLKGESSNNFGSDEFMGYEVENGLGCFMDEKVMDMLDVMDEKDLDNYEKDIKRKIRETEAFGVEVVIDKKSDCNIIVFPSGWNDGTFPSYYGYDKDGNLSRLVTDFMVIEK